MYRRGTLARHPNCDQVLTPNGMGYRPTTVRYRSWHRVKGPGYGQKPHTKGCDAAEGLRDDLANPLVAACQAHWQSGRGRLVAVLVSASPPVAQTRSGVSHSCEPIGSSDDRQAHWQPGNCGRALLGSQIQVQRVDVCRSLRPAAQDGFPYHLRECPWLYAVRAMEPRQEQPWHMCADLGLGASWPSVQRQGIFFA